MDNIELIALLVTVICLVSFSIVFTVLFRNYYKTNIDKLLTGEEDIDLIDNAISEAKRKKDKGSKAFRISTRILGYAFFLVIIAFFGVSLYARFSGSLIPFGDSTLVVIASGSMSERNERNTYLDEYNLNNQFNTYDIIGISKYDNESQVKLYDVVAYRSESGTTIVHRIISEAVEEGERVFVTRGDSNPASDPGTYYEGYLHYDDILGYYNETRIQSLGIFVIFLQSNAGIITIVAIAYCLFMFDYYNTKYEKAIDIRTNQLIELMNYDLSKPLSEEDVQLVYKQEVLYKNSLYTFSKGKFISKEVITDKDTLEKVKENMISITKKDTKSKKVDVDIKNVRSKKHHKVKDVDEENVKEVITSLKEETKADEVVVTPLAHIFADAAKENNEKVIENEKEATFAANSPTKKVVKRVKRVVKKPVSGVSITDIETPITAPSVEPSPTNEETLENQPTPLETGASSIPSPTPSYINKEESKGDNLEATVTEASANPSSKKTVIKRVKRVKRVKKINPDGTEAIETIEVKEPSEEGEKTASKEAN